MGPFWVEAEHIGRLDQYQLPRLLRMLLWVEADEHGLCKSGIHVPLEINVSDGGEDGRIEWSDGPDKTEFIPNRLTVFQCKAQKMEPNDCYKELLVEKSKPKNLKPQVKDVLEQGGAYVVFCTQAANPKMYKRRLKKMRTALKAGRLKNWKSCDIDFFDAAKIASWVNKFAATQIYVLECFGRSIPGNLRTWDGWSRHDDLQGPYIETEKIQAYKEAIRECCRGQGKGIVRITGLSGLGKTRLVFEAFRVSADGPEDIESLQNKVVYANSPGDGSGIEQFIGECQKWEVAGLVLVIDDCEPKIHNRLTEALKYRKSHIRLITLDYTAEKEQIDYDCINLKSEDCTGVVRGILEDKYSGLPKATLEKIEEFAQGFASIAVLLGRQVKEEIDEIGSLSSKRELVAKLLFGREPEDKETLTVLKICSLFDHFRLEPPDGGEHVEYMAEVLGGVEKRVFLDTCDKYERRGILQRRGMYVRMCPIPLAITLAVEWFENPYHDVAKMVKDLEKHGLMEGFADQAKKLHFSSKARKIIQELYGPQAPFGNPEALFTEEGSRLFRALVEVDPQVTVAALERCLEGYVREDILGITGGVRRNLVCALEKLCWWVETFRKAGMLLLRLSAAENESWGNNATGQFLGLARIYLSGTQAGLEERMGLFKEALHSESAEERVLGVKALGNAMKTHGFSRSTGAESQGSRMPERDYEPKRDEVKEYWQECLGLLVNVAVGKGGESELAGDQFAAHIVGMITRGMLDGIEEGISKISQAKGGYWPAARAAIHRVLDIRGEDMSKEIKSRIECLETLLVPKSLQERLRLIVSIPDYRHRKNEKGEFVDLVAEEAQGLAEELGQRSDWYDSLEVVLHGEQRAGYVFGRRLGELSKGQDEFVAKGLEVLRAVPVEEGNPVVLGGFLGGTGNRELTDKTLEILVSDEVLVRYAVRMTACVEIDDKHLRKLMGVIGKEGLPVGEFEILSFGRALDKVSAGTVMELCQMLGEQGTPGLQSGIHVLYMYCYQNDERFAKCRNTFKGILGRTADILVGASGTRCGHMWESIAKRIIQTGERDVELAKTLVRGLIDGCRGDSISYSTIEHSVKDVVAVLLREYCEEVWPRLGEGLIGNEWTLVHNLEHVLGVGHEKEGCEAVMTEVPEDELVTWCRDNTPRAPAIIANLVPVFKNEEEAKWHPLAQRLIDEFGDLEEVRSRLSMNLWGFSSWGSRAPYYERRIQLLKTLLKHRCREVRAWATMGIEGFEKDRGEAQMEAEEWEWGIH